MRDDDNAAPEHEALAWEHDLTLATNPFILSDFIRVVVVSLLTMEILVYVMGLITGDPILLPLKFLGLIGGILAALFLIATLLVYGNRYHARFQVDAKGAQMEDAGQGRRFKWLMVALGVLARRPGVAMSATSGPSGYGDRVSWREVRRVTVHRRLRVVTLCNSWRSLLRLYCPPELFDEVAERAQSSVAQAEQRRARRESRAKAARKKRE